MIAQIKVSNADILLLLTLLRLLNLSCFLGLNLLGLSLLLGNLFFVVADLCRLDIDLLSDVPQLGLDSRVTKTYKNRPSPSASA